MTEKTASEAAELSPALAEPTVHVRRGWVTGLGLASLGMWMASLTPLQVSLPRTTSTSRWPWSRPSAPSRR